MATTCSKKRIRTKAERMAALKVLAAFKAMAVERLHEHFNILRTIRDELAARVGSEYGAFCERIRAADGEACDQIAPLELD